MLVENKKDAAPTLYSVSKSKPAHYLSQQIYSRPIKYINIHIKHNILG